MIRRLFWLLLGVALGVAGYRRLSSLARRAWRPQVRASGLAGFLADVREGMDVYAERQARYMRRQPGGTSSTLDPHRGKTET